MSFIEVRGATEHNLRDVSVDIPKKKLVAFTGVSGSGKSSLVFDTIYIEAFRRFADASHAPVYVMGSSSFSRTARPKFRAIRGLPPALGLSQRQGVAGKLSTVGTVCGVTDLLRVYFAAFGDVFCRTCDIPLRATTFSQVVDKVFEQFPEEKIIVVAPLVEKRKGAFAAEIEKFRQLGFSRIRINGDTLSLQDEDVKIKIDAKKLNTIEVLIDYIAVSEDKRKRLERAVSQAVEHGKGLVKIELPAQNREIRFNTKSSCPQCSESAPRLDPRYFSHSSLGQCLICGGTGSSDEDLPADLFPCRACGGSRLSASRPIVRVRGHTFETLQSLEMNELQEFVQSKLESDSKTDKARQRVVSELSRLLETLLKVGLKHLSLNRSGASLSPGDLQRLRLSAMISNRLNGALYVLDEPCQGLTATEVERLVGVLQELIYNGSSVVVVEHHPVFLEKCDQVFVMGPGAGSKGGNILSSSSGAAFHEDLPVFKQKKSIKKMADWPGVLTFKDLSLRTITIKEIALPQGAITVLRGPAGTGKGSFVELCVLPCLQALAEGETQFKNCFFGVKKQGEVVVTHVNDIRPGSLTRASRRSVAAALEVIGPLRELLAQLPSAQVLGLSEMHFSWNSKLGRCSHCEGRGYIELMQRYGPPVRVECEMCLGAKLNSRSLLPRFKGYNMADIMNLSIEDAQSVFAHVKAVEQRLARASQFGLGYVRLGQGMDSLSGGELQRLTLTMELKRAQLAGAWFLLVHPGTGLHAPDIEVLGNLMQLMVERGATFVVLENREEFLRYADHVVTFQ